MLSDWFFQEGARRRVRCNSSPGCIRIDICFPTRVVSSIWCISVKYLEVFSLVFSLLICFHYNYKNATLLL